MFFYFGTITKFIDFFTKKKKIKLFVFTISIVFRGFSIFMYWKFYYSSKVALT